MIKSIRTSKVSKIICCYLALMMVLQITAPIQAYALTEGPSQPEFNSFTPIGTSDMVSLTSGDFNYNIPIMDVGGYPINLSYDSGVSMDQEASWVGLGWNLNIGQINRQVRGLPDDFKGDEMIMENNLKDNVTIGVNPYVNFQLLGAFDNASVGGGLNVQYNNYMGVTATPSFGLSFNVSKYVSVGMNLTSSSTEGVSITPSASLHTKGSEEKSKSTKFSGSISPSITYNSRQGLQSFNLSSSASVSKSVGKKTDADGNVTGYKGQGNLTGSGRGSISFVNNTFTPSKRLGFKNTSGTFSFSVGPDVWSAHAEFSISASVGIQQLKDKLVRDKAYGYENTDLATADDVLDFNREKEQSTFTKNTLVLPITNYTYDIYNVQGQGLGGMFRPYRGQTGYVYEGKVTDQSNSLSLGAEIEGGAGVHVGASITYSPSVTYTGAWNTQATPFFKEKVTNNHIDYEKSYYKMVGENRVDEEYNSLFESKLGGNSPIALQLNPSKNAINKYWKKVMNGSTSALADASSFTTQIKREHREKRNQAIQKVTSSDISLHGLHNIIHQNQWGKPHHTMGYIITDESGNRNVFGQSAYNKIKKEVSFAVDNNDNCGVGVTCSNGLISYCSTGSSPDNSSNNRKGIDHFFNSETTPAYAHTYLLNHILSTDYEDLTGNGPSDDDLGTYTKFEYVTYDDYKWRVPFQENKASYNEGLKTLNTDQKASYLYGEKELKYVNRIITKSHVAFIDLEERKDGFGVKSEAGGYQAGASQAMYKIKSIRLYSKPEVMAANGTIQDPGVNSAIKPIKTAHFIYDYSLCKQVDNNNNSQSLTASELSNTKGKLTLKKVYFTYKNSNMGKYTPYVFNYDLTPQNPQQGIDYNNNPDYNVKNYDIWGNYKKNQATSCNDEVNTNPQEFPYVDQTNRAQQDVYAAAWTLSSVQLPSGGLINVKYEADDYQYVQNKRAMQMFKVVGVSENTTGINTGSLYGNGYDAKYVVIKTDNQTTALNYKDRYIGHLINEPVFFNFMVNMTDGKKDYVQGYFKIDNSTPIVFNPTTKYLFIPMQKLNREGKNSSSDLVNPISLAGWYFGRQYLNREIFGQPNASDGVDIVSIGRSLVNNLSGMIQIFSGPNGHLKMRGCAKNFNPNKSWIRLLEPSGSKIGGGSRVKSIEMYDKWEEMLSIPSNSPQLSRYKKKYGQEYSYTNENGKSSGVATYEPNVSKENPLVQPFYHNAQNMVSPPAVSYIEEPFGESFYPSPTVTYARVSVKNLPADGQETETGKVVTQHYTSYDFPTITDYTTLDGPSKIFDSNENNVVGNMLSGMLGLPITVKSDLTLSQGFYIETNDMNGRIKKQEVFNQAGSLISGVEYKYLTDASNNSILDNTVRTVDSNGKNTAKTIGVHYDVVNDFRENYSNSKTYGVNVNVDVIPLGFIPIVIGMGVPERADHTQILRTAVTTKVLHKTGILKEKIAYDLGSRVSTKNLAWDALTGQVILTETINEYDDKYYSFTYPGYWNYEALGMASQNLDIQGRFIPNPSGGTTYYSIAGIAAADTKKYLKPGDELMIKSSTDIFLSRAWVVDNSSALGVKIMLPNGSILSSSLGTNRFRVWRSGYKNTQAAPMASVTSMRNPLGNNNTSDITYNTFVYSLENDSKPVNWKVINASAIEYTDVWASQCENRLPGPAATDKNPYLYNIKGEWRPNKSYAYLTGRTADKMATRFNGFFKSFNPLYRFNGNWEKNDSNWTYASEVSMYNPFGVELENKDALDRYSSAQYGYNYKLPVAVASNSEYREMGFDGFEDYRNINTPTNYRTHFGFSEHLSSSAFITEDASHTGKRSIAVKQRSEIRFVRKVDGCYGAIKDTIRPILSKKVAANKTKSSK